MRSPRRSSPFATPPHPIPRYLTVSRQPAHAVAVGIGPDFIPVAQHVERPMLTAAAVGPAERAIENQTTSNIDSAPFRSQILAPTNLPLLCSSCASMRPIDSLDCARSPPQSLRVAAKQIGLFSVPFVPFCGEQVLLNSSLCLCVSVVNSSSSPSSSCSSLCLSVFVVCVDRANSNLTDILPIHPRRSAVRQPYKQPPAAILDNLKLHARRQRLGKTRRISVL